MAQVLQVWTFAVLQKSVNLQKFVPKKVYTFQVATAITVSVSHNIPLQTGSLFKFLLNYVDSLIII